MPVEKKKNKPTLWKENEDYGCLVFNSEGEKWSEKREAKYMFLQTALKI